MTKRNPGPPPVTITCTVCGVEGPFDSFELTECRKGAR